jgi:hypothetical protein
MRNKIEKAFEKESSLKVSQTGYGQYLIECEYRGKRISCHSTDSLSVDNLHSEPEEKDERGRNRVSVGYEALLSECISKNR